MKAGPSLEGDMAFDDVQLTDDRCPPRGFCDFENTMCNWSNLGGGIDQGDWLHGRGGPQTHTRDPALITLLIPHKVKTILDGETLNPHLQKQHRHEFSYIA